MSTARGRPFEPGNRLGRGRPPGSRNKANAAFDEVLGKNGRAILTKLVVQAIQGDSTAMRLCVERLLPARRQAPVKFKLPRIATAEDVSNAVEHLLQAVARGQLTPLEGQTIGAVLDVRRRAIETQEIERRLRTLELNREEKAL